jgi:hypothetical protein
MTTPIDEYLIGIISWHFKTPIIDFSLLHKANYSLYLDPVMTSTTCLKLLGSFVITYTTLNKLGQSLDLCVNPESRQSSEFGL